MHKLGAVVLISTLVLPALASPGLAREQNHWHGDIRSFHEHDSEVWRAGRWHHGFHHGKSGWWWVVGGVWYFYPSPVYPYPDPYLPPGVAMGTGPTWYYCANPPGYYPYVSACLIPWQAVPAEAPAPVIVAPTPPPPAPQSGGIDKSTVGTVAGAIVGGVAGAQFGKGSGKLAATAIGTLLGAFIGRDVGESLDQADQLAAQQAAQKAYQAPIGQAITWNNPDSGHSGTVTPSRDGNDANGNYCREFQQSVTVGGKTEQAVGTACRMTDGSWKIVNQ